MAEIVCDVNRLTHSHIDRTRSRLRLLSDEPLQITPKKSVGQLGLIASHGARTTEDPNEWMFPSIVDTVSCQYRELWVPVGQGDQHFRLQNLQFELREHPMPGQSPVEIVAFHWHLREESVHTKNTYEGRPHLHVQTRLAALTRSHLVVTLGTELNEQGSFDYLEKLLDDAMNMLASQVLNRLE